MADKRTTPDPGDRAHRKRPAPTIDLEATEMPAAGEPPVTPDPAQEQPEAAHEPGPADGGSGSFRKRGLSAALLQLLLAGFAGAVIMTAALLALWFAGLVPARYTASTGADPAPISALNDRMTKLEAAIARIPGNDPAVSERLSSADNAMKSLGIALTALNKRSDEVAANTADARARADAADKAVTELRTSVQDLSKNTSAGLSPSDVDTVQKRLAALEQTAKTAPADNPARLALSAAALRDAAVSGTRFVTEFNEAKSLGANEKTLAALVPFAASGVPGPAALAQELRALTPAMLKASGAQTPTGGFLERLQANAGKLVRIRPVDAATGDDPSAVLARVEIETARADIDGALLELGKLDAATRAPAQDWIDKVQARQAALAAARQLAADTARALGKR